MPRVLEKYNMKDLGSARAIQTLIQENENLKNTIPKAHISTTSIQLTDSAEDLPIENVKIKGATSQVQYEGYNLYDVNLAENSTINIETGEITSTNYYKLSDYIEVDSNTSYIISLVHENQNKPYSLYKAVFYDENKNFVSGVQSSLTQNTSYSFSTANSIKYVRFAYLVIIDNISSPKSNVMLTTGSTVKDYEPYTGGQASPNPDYKQDVHTVTGDCEVELNSKNLHDYSSWFQNIQGGHNISYSNRTNNSIILTASSRTFTPFGYQQAGGNSAVRAKVQPNTQYTFSCTSTFLSGTVGMGIYIFMSDTIYGDYNKIASQDWTNKITFTTGENTQYVWFRIDLFNQCSYEISNIQLEKGSIATTYTPHAHQTFPISLGTIELCKIGDYQDYFYKESNKWYLHKEIGKVVYDGTETGESHYWYVQDENNHSYQITDNTIHLKESKKGICNCFIINNSGASPYLYPILQAGTAYCRFVTYNITGTISTLEEWKRWLSSNNIVFYYPLATPTDIEITDTTLIAQLEALINMKTYKTITNIDCTGEDLAPVLDCDYYQDMSTINDRLDELEARIELLEN